MRRERWLVVGGGVGGIAGAWLLARAGHEVTLVEAGSELGRASRSISHQGFELDFGCHLFGNDSQASTGILRALLEGEIAECHAQPAAISDGVLCENTELPDLSSVGEAGIEAMREAAAVNGPRPSHLREWLERRHGEPIGTALAARAKKMWRVDLDELDPDARHAGPFRRVRVANDEEARRLKQDPALDRRIAVRRDAAAPGPATRAEGPVSTRSFYPGQGSMGGFSRAARRVLEKADVTLRLGCTADTLDTRGSDAELRIDGGERILADRVLWARGLPELEPCLHGTRELTGRVQGVPMTVYWFVVDHDRQGPHAWVNDWDAEDCLFRASFPARYGAPRRADGKAVVCCEVPTLASEEPWTEPLANAVRVLEEIRRHGLVTGEADLLHHMRMPRTYQLPRVGYREAAASLIKSLARDSRVCVPEEWRFTSSGSITATARALQEVGGI